MKLASSAYAGPADQAAMASLVAADAPHNLHIIDLPYRVSSWAFGLPETTLLFRDEQGVLQGWACLQTPFWTIDLVVRKPGLLEPVLGEASRQAGNIATTRWGHPCWFMPAFEDQPEWIAALERQGFSCVSFLPEASWSKGLLVKDLAGPLEGTALPEGFRLRPSRGAQDIQALVDLQQAAFQTTNMSLDWRSRVLAQPAYLPGLDLLVETQEGRPAGFLLAWFSQEGRGKGPAGQVEPMGVHPDFQRRGLGQALLGEAFRRLKTMGAREVYVECDDPPDSPACLSYRAAGFDLAHRLLVFRKDF